MRRKMIWIVSLVGGACAISSLGADELAAPKVKERETVNLMTTDAYPVVPAAGLSVRDQIKLYPITGAKTYVVSNAQDGIAGVDEKLIYTNPLANFAAEIPQLQLVSDDIKLSVATNCPLRRYTLQVIGKANPNACGGPGISCGPVTIDFELFDECPGAGGFPIDGTAGCVSNDPGRLDCLPMPSEFDITEVEFSVPQGSNVPLGSTIWLGVQASRNGTGVIVGTPAQLGFSVDVLDFLGFPCNASLGGFPRNPYAAFNSSIWGASNCADTCLAYQNIRAANAGVNAGADNCIADDVRLNNPCNMVEMEVGVRNPGIYSVELRRSSNNAPAGNCVGGQDSMQQSEIPGTYKRFLVTQSGLAVKRFVFDPPVEILNPDLFAVLVPNNTNAQWILTGRDASIGDTLPTYVQWDGADWELVEPATSHGGLHFTITCAGACPVGACCDQYVRDEDNEAVCRDLPEINCPFPPKGSALRPAWAEGISCNVCSGGARDGASCETNDDCSASACVGGLVEGSACAVDQDCSRCGDILTTCENDQDCPGADFCRLATCEPGTCVPSDPFQRPCGDSACCQPDGNCNDLTLNECNLLLPLDESRLWELGQFCNIGAQRCPLPACIDGEGDCLTSNPKTCNGGPDAGDSCLFDSNCTSTNDGECQSIPPECFGGDFDGDACNNDLDCIPGGLCVTDVCVGGARAGEECAGLRNCRESFCESFPGCSNPFCCDEVCRWSPGPPNSTDFCCNVHWDSACADLAAIVCPLEPGNDDCAPGDRTSGAVEIIVNGSAGGTNHRTSSISSDDAFCCNQGISRCDGGCPPEVPTPAGKPCEDNFDCSGAADGFCNFPDDFSPGSCSGGCNAQEVCLDSDNLIFNTTCVGGLNNGLPCKPRCNGGADDGEPCGSEDDCADGATCDGTIDCPDGTCDNAFCEGADNGVCADPVPEPGGRGVGSVWYYFTVPEEVGSETVSIEVSTCESTSPARDSLLQVFATSDSDAGLCDDVLGVCDDGSFCDRVAQDCGDASECLRTELACSVSEQDCPVPTSACKFNVGLACDDLSVVGCNDDAGSICGDRPLLSSVCMPDLKRGESYFIDVSAKTEDVKDGEYRVRVRTVSACDPPPAGSCVNLFCVGGPLDGEPCLTSDQCVVPEQPANDFCSNAIDIPTAEGDTVIPFTLDGATFDCREVPCNTNLQNDIWYQWTAPEVDGDGTIEIKTCGDGVNPSPDTEMMVYYGCGCPAPTLPIAPACFSASNNPACITSAGTLTPLEVSSGDCLTIRVADNRGSGGTGELTVTYQGPPDCDDGSIFSFDPPNGVTDAGWEVDCSTGAGPLGIDTIQVFGPANNASSECWTLCESGAVGAPNSISSVVEGPVGLYTVTLARPITPGHCTSIIYNEVGGAPSSETYKSLPGDVDGLGASNATDVLALIDALNGIPGAAPWGEYSTDVDRSGATNATDVLGVIDALNGAGPCSIWNNVQVPADCGTCPVP